MFEAVQRERFPAGKWQLWTVVTLVVYVLSMAPLETVAAKKEWQWLKHTNYYLFLPLRYYLHVDRPRLHLYNQYREWCYNLFPAQRIW